MHVLSYKEKLKIHYPDLECGNFSGSFFGIIRNAKCFFILSIFDYWYVHTSHFYGNELNAMIMRILVACMGKKEFKFNCCSVSFSEIWHIAIILAINLNELENSIEIVWLNNACIVLVRRFRNFFNEKRNITFNYWPRLWISITNERWCQNRLDATRILSYASIISNQQLLESIPLKFFNMLRNTQEIQLFRLKITLV